MFGLSKIKLWASRSLVENIVQWSLSPLPFLGIAFTTTSRVVTIYLHWVKVRQYADWIENNISFTSYNITLKNYWVQRWEFGTVFIYVAWLGELELECQVRLVFWPLSHDFLLPWPTVPRETGIQKMEKRLEILADPQRNRNWMVPHW